MVEETKTPPSSLTPQAKMVGLGAVAFAILYSLFAPTSSPPTSPPPKPAETPAKPEHRGPDFVTKGTVVHIVDTAPGCSALENLTKFRQLATEGDKDAVVAMVDQGQCEILAKGTAVTVEDSSVWKMAECVRKPGDVDCLWTMLKATDGRFR